MHKLLVICGVSGSGKSTLEANLIQEYPELFHKWQQVTTRKPRTGERNGDPYVFLQPSTYEHIKDVLVGRLGNKPDSTFKDKYGSFPDFVEGKISTVILAEEGLEDLLANEYISNNVNVYVFGLDVDTADLDSSSRREGRDNEFLDIERGVLKYANRVYVNGNGKYLPPKVLVENLTDIFI